MRRYLRPGLTSIFLFAILACGHQYNTQFSTAEPVLHDVKLVAVLPLENLSETTEAGQAVADQLVTELHRLGRFRVLGKVELEEFFKKGDVTLPPRMDRATAVEIGRRLQVDAVFYGSVSEYVYRAEAQDDDEREPAVGINLRLASTKTGTVIWGASHARSSYEVFSYEKDVISKVVGHALRDMLAPLRGT